MKIFNNMDNRILCVTSQMYVFLLSRLIYYLIESSNMISREKSEQKRDSKASLATLYYIISFMLRIFALSLFTVAWSLQGEVWPLSNIQGHNTSYLVKVEDMEPIPSDVNIVISLPKSLKPPKNPVCEYSSENSSMIPTHCSLISQSDPPKYNISLPELKSQILTIELFGIQNLDQQGDGEEYFSLTTYFRQKMVEEIQQLGPISIIKDAKNISGLSMQPSTTNSDMTMNITLRNNLSTKRVRIKLPQQFILSHAKCEGDSIQSKVYFNYIIQCSNLSNSTRNITIAGLMSPKVEMKVSDVMVFFIDTDGSIERNFKQNSPVQITPKKLMGQVRQENTYQNSSCTYEFSLQSTLLLFAYSVKVWLGSQWQISPQQCWLQGMTAEISSISKNILELNNIILNTSQNVTIGVKLKSPSKKEENTYNISIYGQEGKLSYIVDIKLQVGDIVGEVQGSYISTNSSLTLSPVFQNYTDSLTIYLFPPPFTVNISIRCYIGTTQLYNCSYSDEGKIVMEIQGEQNYTGELIWIQFPRPIPSQVYNIVIEGDQQILYSEQVVKQGDISNVSCQLLIAGLQNIYHMSCVFSNPFSQAYPLLIKFPQHFELTSSYCYVQGVKTFTEVRMKEGQAQLWIPALQTKQKIHIEISSILHNITNQRQNTDLDLNFSIMSNYHALTPLSTIMSNFSTPEPQKHSLTLNQSFTLQQKEEEKSFVFNFSQLQKIDYLTVTLPNGLITTDNHYSYNHAIYSAYTHYFIIHFMQPTTQENYQIQLRNISTPPYSDNISLSIIAASSRNKYVGNIQILIETQSIEGTTEWLTLTGEEVSQYNVTRCVRLSWNHSSTASFAKFSCPSAEFIETDYYDLQPNNEIKIGLKGNSTTLPLILSSSQSSKLCTLTTFDIDEHKLEQGNISLTNIPKKINFQQKMPKGNVKRSPSEGYISHLVFTYHSFAAKSQQTFYLCLSIPTTFQFLATQLICTLNKGEKKTCTITQECNVMMEIDEGWDGKSENYLNITTQNGIMFPQQAGTYALTVRLLNKNEEQFEKSVFPVEVLPKPMQTFTVSAMHMAPTLQNVYSFLFQIEDKAVPSFAGRGRIQLGFPLNVNNTNIFDGDLGYGDKEKVDVPCRVLLNQTYEENIACTIISKPHPDNNSYIFVEMEGFESLQSNTSVQVYIAILKNPSTIPSSLSFSLLITSQETGENTPICLYKQFFTLTTDNYSVTQNASNINVSFSKGAITQENKSVSIDSSELNDPFIILFPPEFQLGSEVNKTSCFILYLVNWIVCNSATFPLQIAASKYPLSIPDQIIEYEVLSISSNSVIRINETMNISALKGELINSSVRVLSPANGCTVDRKISVVVSFTIPHPIREGGMIIIQFPSNTTLLPWISATCRSAVNLGSYLVSLHDDTSGMIDCQREETSWIISIFAPVSANALISIQGQIQLPGQVASDLGQGAVRTYASDGGIIDEGQFSMGIQMNQDVLELNINTLLVESKIVREGHQGQLSLKATLPFDISETGEVSISLPKNSASGASTGFNGPSQNILCTIQSEDIPSDIECQVSNIQQNQTAIQYTLTPSESLSANQSYIFTINLDDPNKGITHPILAGQYIIGMGAKSDDEGTANAESAMLWEVVGQTFQDLTIFSTVHQPNAKTIFIIYLVPSAPISVQDNIVIDFPTTAADGTALFEQDLGMGYANSENILFYSLNPKFSSISCQIFTGNKELSSSIKVICYGWEEDIQLGEQFKIVFELYNPDSEDLAIPIAVYTYDNQSKKKIYEVLEVSFSTNTQQGKISDSSNLMLALSESSSNLTLTLRNSKQMNTGDYYILKFEDLLLTEGYFQNKFFYNQGLTSLGDVIYLKNFQAIALKVGEQTLPSVASGSTTRNGFIKEVYQNFYLYPVEAFVIYFSSDTFQRIKYESPSLIKVDSSGTILSPVDGNLIQGQSSDYQMHLSLDTISQQFMKIVKKVSVKFPPQLTLVGGSCVELKESEIRIKKCEVDVDNQVLWISIDTNEESKNAHKISVRTVDYAVRNPNNASIDLKNSIVKFYTWRSVQGQPEIDLESSNFVLVQFDQSNIPSAVVDYAALATPNRHDKVLYYFENFVSQFQPGSTDLGTLRMKTPFIFTFYAMDDFPPLTGQEYHEINVKFSDYYGYDSPINNKDLVQYEPSCRIMSKAQKQCFIDNGIIYMQFQEGISEGEKILVEFSIINPKNEEDCGFSLNDLSQPLVSLPISFTIYGHESYQTEAEPFHTYFDAPDTNNYPSFGIASVSLQISTQVAGKLNYIDFTISLHRSDINGLILQIPVLDAKKNPIYSDPTLMSLESGDKYPCSAGFDELVFCYYEKGSIQKLGKPNRIFITNFDLPDDNTLSLRILFTNPDIEGVYPSFIFTALGGDSAPYLMGRQLKGRYQLSETFKVSPVQGFSSTSNTCQVKPLNGMWMESNNQFHVQQAQKHGSYVILQWVLETSNYGQVSHYSRVASQIVDEFIVEANGEKRLFLVRKLSADYQGSSHYHFGLFRNKHFLFDDPVLHLLQKTNYVRALCQVNQSYVQNDRALDEYGVIAVNIYDIDSKVNEAQAWHYASIYLGEITSQLVLSDSDPSDLVITVTFIGTLPYASLLKTDLCQINSGVTSTDKLRVPYCEQDLNNNRLVFRNFNAFSSNYLKFFFKAQNLADVQSTSARVLLKAFANEDAFNSDKWMMFYGSTDQKSLNQDSNNSPFNEPHQSLAQSSSVSMLTCQVSQETELSIWITGLNYPVGSGSWLNFIIDHLNIPNPFPATSQNEVAYIDCKCISGASIVEDSTTVYEHPDCVKYKIGQTFSIGVWANAISSHSLVCYFPGFFIPNQSALNINILLKKDLLFSQHSGIPTQSYPKMMNIQRGLLISSPSNNLVIVENIDWKNAQLSTSLLSYSINITGQYVTKPAVYISTYAPEPSVNYCNNTNFQRCRVYLSFINRRYYVVALSSQTTSQIILSGDSLIPPSVSTGSQNRRFIGFAANSVYQMVLQTVVESNLQMINIEGKTGVSQFSSTTQGMDSLLVLSFDLTGQKLFNSDVQFFSYYNPHIAVTLPSFSNITNCTSIFTHNNLDPTIVSLPCTVTDTTILISSASALYLQGTLSIIVNVPSLPSSSSYTLTIYDQYVSDTSYSRTAQSTGTMEFRQHAATALNSDSIRWERMTYKDYRLADGPIRFIVNNDYSQLSQPYLLVKSTGHEITSSDVFICFIKQHQPYPTVTQQTSCIYHSSNTIKVNILASMDKDTDYQISIFKNQEVYSSMFSISNTNPYTLTITTMEGSTAMFENEHTLTKYENEQPILLYSMQIITTQAEQFNSILLDLRVSDSISSFLYWEFILEGIFSTSTFACYFGEGFEAASGDELRCMLEQRENSLSVRVMGASGVLSNTRYQIGLNNLINPSSGTTVNLKVSVASLVSYFPSIFFTTAPSTLTPSNIIQLSGTESSSGTVHLTIQWDFAPSTDDKLVIWLSEVYGSMNNMKDISVTRSGGVLSLLWDDKMFKVFTISGISSGDITEIQFSLVWGDTTDVRELGESCHVAIYRHKQTTHKYIPDSPSPTIQLITSQSAISSTSYPYTLNISYLFGSQVTSDSQCWVSIQFTEGISHILVVHTIIKQHIEKQDNKWRVHLYGVFYEGAISVKYLPNASNVVYRWWKHVGQITSSLFDPISVTTSTPSMSLTMSESHEYFVKGIFKIQVATYAGGSLSELKFIFTPPRPFVSHEQIKITLDDESSLTPSSALIKCLLYPNTLITTPTLVSCEYDNGSFIVSIPSSGLQTIEYVLAVKESDERSSSFLVPSKPTFNIINIQLVTNESKFYRDAATVVFAHALQELSVHHSTLMGGQENVITFTSQFPHVPDGGESFIQIDILSENVDSCLGFRSVFEDEEVKFESGQQIGISTVPSSSAKSFIFCGDSEKPPKIVVFHLDPLVNTTYSLTIPLIKNPESGSQLKYRLRLLNYQQASNKPLILSSSFVRENWVTKTGTSTSEPITLSVPNAEVNKNMTINIAMSVSPASGTTILLKLRKDKMEGFKDITSLNTLTISNYDHDFYEQLGLWIFVKNTGTETNSLMIGEFEVSFEQNIIGVSWLKVYPDQTTVREGSIDSIYPYPIVEINPLRSWSYSNFFLDNGLSQTKAVGQYTFTFRSETATLPSGSHIIINIPPIFSIPQKNCLRFSGLIAKSPALVCEKYRSHQLRIAGYKRVEPNTEISITVYLQIQKSSLGAVSASAMITVFAENGHLIIKGETPEIQLDISKHGSYKVEFQPMESPSMQQNLPEQDYINITQIESRLLSLSAIKILELQVGNFSFQKGDELVLFGFQNIREDISCVIEEDDRKQIGECSKQNSSIIIRINAITERLRIIIVSQMNLSGNDHISGVIKKKNLLLTVPTHQNIAAFNLTINNNQYIEKSSDSQVNFTIQHSFDFPENISSSSLVVIQYCNSFILSQTCTVQENICITHLPNIIIIFTLQQTSEITIIDVPYPYGCEFIMVDVIGDSRTTYNVPNKQSIQQYENDQLVQIQFASTGNKALVDKQAWMQITLAPLLPLHQYDVIVIETQQMTFNQCYFQQFPQIFACKAEQTNITLHYHQQQISRIRAKYWMSNSINTSNWTIKTYQGDVLVGMGNISLSIQTVYSVEGEIQLNNPQQQCVVNQDCQVNLLLPFPQNVSAVDISLPDAYINDSLKSTSELCSVQDKEISCNVEQQKVLHLSLMLKSETVGIHSITMNFTNGDDVLYSTSKQIKVVSIVQELSVNILSDDVAQIVFIIPSTDITNIHLRKSTNFTDSLACRAMIEGAEIPVECISNQNVLTLMLSQSFLATKQVVMYLMGSNLQEGDEVSFSVEQVCKQTNVLVKGPSVSSHSLSLSSNISRNVYQIDLGLSQQVYVSYMLVKIESDLSEAHHIPSQCSLDNNITEQCWLMFNTIMIKLNRIASPTSVITISLTNSLFVIPQTQFNITVSLLSPFNNIIIQGTQELSVRELEMDTIEGEVSIQPNYIGYNDAKYTINISMEDYNFITHGIIKFPFQLHAKSCALSSLHDAQCTVLNSTINFTLYSPPISSFIIQLEGISNPASDGNILLKLYEKNTRGDELLFVNKSIQFLLTIIDPASITFSTSQEGFNITILKKIPRGSQLVIIFQEISEGLGDNASCQVTENLTQCSMSSNKLTTYMKELTPTTNIFVNVKDSEDICIQNIKLIYHNIAYAQGESTCKDN